jgi:hypothetical protein
MGSVHPRTITSTLFFTTLEKRGYPFSQELQDYIDLHTVLLYKKIKQKTDYSYLASLVLLIKVCCAFDVQYIDTYISTTLSDLGIHKKYVYDEEVRIIVLYPSICNDITPRFPRLAKEVDIKNII